MFIGLQAGLDTHKQASASQSITTFTSTTHDCLHSHIDGLRLKDKTSVQLLFYKHINLLSLRHMLLTVVLLSGRRTWACSDSLERYEVLEIRVHCCWNDGMSSTIYYCWLEKVPNRNQSYIQSSSSSRSSQGGVYIVGSSSSSGSGSIAVVLVVVME